METIRHTSCTPRWAISNLPQLYHMRTYASQGGLTTLNAVTIKHFDAPAYPYPIATEYKQRNQGLYGNAAIRTGNLVSDKWKTRARRTWKPNVHTKRMWSPGLNCMVRLRVTTSVLRTIDKVGGLDNYLLGDKAARIKELGPTGWALRWKLQQTKAYQQQDALQAAASSSPAQDLDPQPRTSTLPFSDWKDVVKAKEAAFAKALELARLEQRLTENLDPETELPYESETPSTTSNDPPSSHHEPSSGLAILENLQSNLQAELDQLSRQADQSAAKLLLRAQDQVQRESHLTIYQETPLTSFPAIDNEITEAIDSKGAHGLYTRLHTEQRARYAEIAHSRHRERIRRTNERVRQLKAHPDHGGAPERWVKSGGWQRVYNALAEDPIVGPPTFSMNDYPPSGWTLAQWYRLREEARREKRDRVRTGVKAAESSKQDPFADSGLDAEAKPSSVWSKVKRVVGMK